MRARRIGLISLLLFATLGWILFANLAVRTVPNLVAGPGGATDVVAQFTRVRIAVLVGANPWSDLQTYATGPAAAALASQAAANPGPLPELRLTSGPTANLLWAEPGRAMVELDYTTNREGPVSELHLLDFLDGRWQIESFWRVVADPGGPLVPTPAPGS